MVSTLYYFVTRSHYGPNLANFRPRKLGFRNLAFWRCSQNKFRKLSKERRRALLQSAKKGRAALGFGRCRLRSHTAPRVVGGSARRLRPITRPRRRVDPPTTRRSRAPRVSSRRVSRHEHSKAEAARALPIPKTRAQTPADRAFCTPSSAGENRARVRGRERAREGKEGGMSARR